MDKNMKFGLIAFISIIALFVLSLWISQTPADADNSVRFGILTLLPPLVAIGLAFLTKQTILSLFVGVFVGEFMLNVNDYNIIATITNAFLDMGSTIITCIRSMECRYCTSMFTHWRNYTVDYKNGWNQGSWRVTC